MDNASTTQNLMNSIIEASEWSTSPQTQSLIQGIIRTFKAHYTQYSRERIVNTMKENPNRENIMKVYKDHTTEDAIVATEKAMKAIRPKTISSCWETVSRCCIWLHRIYDRASQGDHERDGGIKEKKRGRGGENFKIWRNSRTNRHQMQGINRRWLDGDECFLTSARQWRRRTSRSRKRVDIRHSGRRVPVIHDCFWLLWHGPLYDTGTETKAISKRRMSTI